MDPLQALTASQRKALGLANDAFEGLVRSGKAAVAGPEETVARMTALVAAIGDLAASSTKPMESLLAGQRNLANAMSAFATLQREMADVVERLADHHNSVLDAMEALATPALAVTELMSSDGRAAKKRTTSPRSGAGSAARSSAAKPAKRKS